MGQTLGTTVVGSVGGLSESTGVLPYRVARNAQLPSDLAQRDALDFGLLHRSPQRQLTRGQRPFLWSMGFAVGVADMVVIFDDRIRLEVSQVSQLSLAEAVVAEAFHYAAGLRSGSQSAMGSAQCASLGRCWTTGDDLTLVANQEVTVGVFQDFHLDTGVAGTLRTGQQLQGKPPVLDRVVPGHLSTVLEPEYFLQGLLRAPRTVDWIGQFGWDGKLGVVAGQEVQQHGVGLVEGMESAKRSSVTSRSWKVPAARPTRPLACGKRAKELLEAQLLHGPAEVSGFHQRLKDSRLI